MKKLSDAEHTFVMYQHQSTGSFYTALIMAMMRADQANQFRLSLAYPELMEVVRNFQNTPGYWEELLQRKQHELKGEHEAQKA